MMFWTMMIRIQKINISCENSNESQESAVLYNHEAIDVLTNMMSWVLVMIWLQDHISIWQAKSEAQCADITIIKFACKCRWQTNCELISSSIVFKTIWKNTTYFHKSQTQ